MKSMMDFNHFHFSLPKLLTENEVLIKSKVFQTFSSKKLFFVGLISLQKNDFQKWFATLKNDLENQNFESL